MPTILLISPDPGLHRLAQRASESCKDSRCIWINRWEADFGEIIEAEPAVILAHLGQEHPADGFILPLVETFSNKRPSIPAIVVADSYDGPIFRDVLASGARECMARPVDERRLTFFLESELVAHRPTSTATPLEQAEKSSHGLFQRTCQQASRIAAKNTTILLTGETGVGKSFLARLIHDSSPRAKLPFVALNCGAISESLAESELFGHKKGAFTGANDDYQGHFAAAGKGTLFLDEVDSLPPSLQAKLLRALDDRVFEPVGSVQQKRLDARIIAATSRPIERAVAEKKFRKDLMYRLRVVELEIPPLRRRTQDFRTISLELLKGLCHDEQVPIPVVAEGAWRRLESHRWPGNLRELRNALEYAVLFMSDGVVTASDLPDLVPDQSLYDSPGVPDWRAEEREQARQAPASDARREGRRDNAHQELLDVLLRCGYNKSQAARELGISRNGLYKRMKSLGM